MQPFTLWATASMGENRGSKNRVGRILLAPPTPHYRRAVRHRAVSQSYRAVPQSRALLSQVHPSSPSLVLVRDVESTHEPEILQYDLDEFPHS